MNGDFVTLHRSGDGGGTFGSAIASIQNIEAAEHTADMQENTEYGNTEDAGWKTYEPGMKDGGEYTVSIKYKTGQTEVDAILDSFENGTLEHHQLQFPAPISRKKTFKAYVSKVGTPIPKGQFIQRVIGLKITGKPKDEALT
mgnify:CR=1 FL=1|tara:strand:- start:101 stop:526 length:426 start_codon:yes stop_codon:yes gene_type:complete